MRDEEETKNSLFEFSAKLNSFKKKKINFLLNHTIKCTNKDSDCEKVAHSDYLSVTIIFTYGCVIAYTSD